MLELIFMTFWFKIDIELGRIWLGSDGLKLCNGVACGMGLGCICLYWVWGLLLTTFGLLGLFIVFVGSTFLILVMWVF